MFLSDELGECLGVVVCVFSSRSSGFGYLSLVTSLREGVNKRKIIEGVSVR